MLELSGWHAQGVTSQTAGFATPQQQDSVANLFHVLQMADIVIDIIPEEEWPVMIIKMKLAIWQACLPTVAW